MKNFSLCATTAIFVLTIYCTFWQLFAACPETKPKGGLCGNVTKAGNIPWCETKGCGNYTTRDDCNGKINVVECKDDVPIDDQPNSPEQTKTGVAPAEALADCYHYYECAWKFHFGGSTCDAKTTKLTHRINPVILKSCQ